MGKRKRKTKQTRTRLCGCAECKGVIKQTYYKAKSHEACDPIQPRGKNRPARPSIHDHVEYIEENQEAEEADNARFEHVDVSNADSITDAITSWGERTLFNKVVHNTTQIDISDQLRVRDIIYRCLCFWLLYT
jgi:hypothetical protein